MKKRRSLCSSDLYNTIELVVFKAEFLIYIKFCIFQPNDRLFPNEYLNFLLISNSSLKYATDGAKMYLKSYT